MTTTLDLVRSLAGTKCVCGASKRERQSFCGRCYGILPHRLQLALWRRMGEGYEEAYVAAEKELREKGRVR